MLSEMQLRTGYVTNSLKTIHIGSAGTGSSISSVKVFRTIRSCRNFCFWSET